MQKDLRIKFPKMTFGLACDGWNSNNATNTNRDHYGWDENDRATPDRGFDYGEPNHFGGFGLGFGENTSDETYTELKYEGLQVIDEQATSLACFIRTNDLSGTGKNYNGNDGAPASTRTIRFESLISLNDFKMFVFYCEFCLNKHNKRENIFLEVDYFEKCFRKDQ